MKEKISNYYLLFFIVAFLLLEGVFFHLNNTKINNQILNEEKEEKIIIDTLSNLKLSAKAVSVYDITKNKELFGLNSKEPLPLASLAKSMAVTVFLNSTKDETISISSNSLHQVGDSGLFVGEIWNTKNLAKAVLIASLNDGISVFEEKDMKLLENMNLKAKKIGMENTVFYNSTGLDIDQKKAGAYASALDANLMASYAFLSFPDIFKATTLESLKIKSESGFEHTFQNTNIVVKNIPNILLSKTGYTALAGGNLTVIFKNKNGENIAITVLGSTFTDRFSDMEKIVSSLYNINYAI